MSLADLWSNLQKKQKPTRRLMNVERIGDYSLHSIRGGEIVYFLVQPTNISVLSSESLAARIYSLMNVLKGFAEVEMLCLDSRESFENNKRFLRERAMNEDIPEIRSLLEQENRHLDRIQVQMATTREFLIIVRLRDQKKQEVFPYLGRIEKLLSEQGFKVRRADGEDIKRLLAIYFEQNVTTEHFEDFDGERWITVMEQPENSNLHVK
ncbi:hypothetical protein LJC63_01915 [Ruminococcaceae bacterium OttesenSCG-928-L11]|nr:hypothetical protein [Ruminococcaceae bacterium OttesenSCG-928-L11]